MPKLSGLINQRELAICARLCDLRSRIGFSQSNLASAIGTTRDQLASVEYGRNPLRYWLADRLCEKFNVCQQWLATGDEPVIGYVGIVPETGIEIVPRELFSAVYDRRVGHIVKRQIQETESLARSITAQPGGADRLLQDRLYNLALCWFGRIPAHLYDEYFQELMAASSAFFQRNRHRFSTAAWPPPTLDQASTQPTFGLKAKKKCKVLLDEIPGTTHIASVKTKIRSLRDLIHRLKHATKAPGAKAALAHKLGVTRQAVSQWLSGESNPTTEATFELLNWVEKFERKQKQNPDAALTATGHKTQLSKSVYEKTKSNPQER